MSKFRTYIIDGKTRTTADQFPRFLIEAALAGEHPLVTASVEDFKENDNPESPLKQFRSRYDILRSGEKKHLEVPSCGGSIARVHMYSLAAHFDYPVTDAHEVYFSDRKTFLPVAKVLAEKNKEIAGLLENWEKEQQLVNEHRVAKLKSLVKALEIATTEEARTKALYAIRETANAESFPQQQQMITCEVLEGNNILEGAKVIVHRVFKSPAEAEAAVAELLSKKPGKSPQYRTTEPSIRGGLLSVAGVGESVNLGESSVPFKSL